MDKFVYATFYARIYARIAITINCTFTIAAVSLLFAGDVVVYWDSFSKRFQEEFNYTDPLLMSDVRSFFDVNLPWYDVFRNESTHLIIEYGTTWSNWCWRHYERRNTRKTVFDVTSSGANEASTTKTKRSATARWIAVDPAIARVHSVSQLLLRFTFLTSLSLRPIVTYGRSLAVITRLSGAAEKGIVSPPRPIGITSALLLASPLLQFLSTFAGSLVLTWQQDLDFHDLMYAPYYAFAISYLLHMLVYTSIELLEPGRMIASRVGARVSIIVTYCWTVWWTLERQIEFLNRKTCHVDVSPLDALCEYLLLLTITLFSLLEWTDVWSLHVTVVENTEELGMRRSKMKVAPQQDEGNQRI